MKFVKRSAVTLEEAQAAIAASGDGDPLALKGARVMLTRSEAEPLGTVIATMIDYRPHAGSPAEARAFVRLDDGCTAWFPILDLEPGPEPIKESDPLPLPGPIVDFWG